MKHEYGIDYENIRLRPLERCDIEKLRNWRNDQSNTEYLTQIAYISQEMQTVWFEHYLENKRELFFAIDEIQELNRIVGSLSLYNIDEESCFFGKILVGDPDAHGRKVGLHATKAAIIIAFEVLKMKTVDLYVFADNDVALNVYQKAGFVIVDKHIAGNDKIEYLMTIKMEDCGYAQHE